MSPCHRHHHLLSTSLIKVDRVELRLLSPHPQCSVSHGSSSSTQELRCWQQPRKKVRRGRNYDANLTTFSSASFWGSFFCNSIYFSCLDNFCSQFLIPFPSQTCWVCPISHPFDLSQHYFKPAQNFRLFQTLGAPNILIIMDGGSEPSLEPDSRHLAVLEAIDANKSPPALARPPSSASTTSSASGVKRSADLQNAARASKKPNFAKVAQLPGPVRAARGLVQEQPSEWQIGAHYSYPVHYKHDYQQQQPAFGCYGAGSTTIFFNNFLHTTFFSFLSRPPSFWVNQLSI